MNTSSNFPRENYHFTKCFDFPLGDSMTPLGKSKYFWGGAQGKKEVSYISAVKWHISCLIPLTISYSCLRCCSLMSAELSFPMPAFSSMSWFHSPSHWKNLFWNIKMFFICLLLTFLIHDHEIIQNFLFPINFCLYSELTTFSTIIISTVQQLSDLISLMSDETTKGNWLLKNDSIIFLDSG